jgi:hypothetical protein
MFLGKAIRLLGFSRRGVFIGEGASSGGGPGGLTMGGRGHGLGHTPLWCGQPLASLRVIFGLREASIKIGGSDFVSSNSKNISCVTFLKHKKAENRKLALWHLVNRLVPENAYKRHEV